MFDVGDNEGDEGRTRHVFNPILDGSVLVAFNVMTPSSFPTFSTDDSSDVGDLNSEGQGELDDAISGSLGTTMKVYGAASSSEVCDTHRVNGVSGGYGSGRRTKGLNKYKHNVIETETRKKHTDHQIFKSAF